VEVDAVVVMPNHLHGILMFGTMADDPDTLTVPPLKRVMQWFKGTSTNDYMLGVRTDGWPQFDSRLWQKGYYEHIIRSDGELDRIRQYIEANPAQWAHDEHNPNRNGR
jgi:REP element-mobilizing transposase RayT